MYIVGAQSTENAQLYSPGYKSGEYDRHSIHVACEQRGAFASREFLGRAQTTAQSALGSPALSPVDMA